MNRSTGANPEDPQQWITVPHWERFQHYGLRKTPVWIKVYTKLMSQPEWADLTLAERGLLVSIWLEYARSNQELRVQDLGRLGVRSRHTQDHLKRLSDAGLIALNSRPDEKRYIKKRTATTVRVRSTATSERPQPMPAAERIRRMINLGVIHTPVELEAELAAADLPPELADQLRTLASTTGNA